MCEGFPPRKWKVLINQPSLAGCSPDWQLLTHRNKYPITSKKELMQFCPESLKVISNNWRIPLFSVKTVCISEQYFHLWKLAFHFLQHLPLYASTPVGQMPGSFLGVHWRILQKENLCHSCLNCANMFLISHLSQFVDPGLSMNWEIRTSFLLHPISIFFGLKNEADFGIWPKNIGFLSCRCSRVGKPPSGFAGCAGAQLR